MAAISWGSRITDYLATLGVDATLAGYISTYVNRMTTQFATVTEDTGLVIMLEKNISSILQVASVVYGLSLNQAQTAAYIVANFPAMTERATLYSNVIVTDLANMIDTPAAEWSVPYTYSAQQVYMKNASRMLTNITKYMRHFATLDDKNDSIPD
jgi:hypothetical protein